MSAIHSRDGLLIIMMWEEKYILGKGSKNDSESCTEGSIVSRKNGVHHGSFLCKNVSGSAHEERGTIHPLDHIDGISGQRERNLRIICGTLHRSSIMNFRMGNGSTTNTLFWWNHLCRL